MKNAALNRMNILAVALFGALAATQMPVAAAAQPAPANP
ncbi:alpha/beta hydrolase, partial [Pseudomonas sp. MD195_PC81_125]|nr:alpha/beta hydrolase [Pseudomonas sp. MD195_PC81_125]